MARDNDNQASNSESTAERGQTSLANRTHEVADEVRQATLGRVESVRDSALTMKNNAAESVRKFGATVRKVGEHLRIEDQLYIAGKANDVSRRIDDFAGYLSSAQLSHVVRDTSAVARRNPALFFGGAFIVGLAAGRFLKDDGVDRSGDSEPATGVVPRLDSSTPYTSDVASAKEAARALDKPYASGSARSGSTLPSGARR